MNTPRCDTRRRLFTGIEVLIDVPPDIRDDRRSRNPNCDGRPFQRSTSQLTIQLRLALIRCAAFEFFSRCKRHPVDCLHIEAREVTFLNQPIPQVLSLIFKNRRVIEILMSRWPDLFTTSKVSEHMSRFQVHEQVASTFKRHGLGNVQPGISGGSSHAREKLAVVAALFLGIRGFCSHSRILTPEGDRLHASRPQAVKCQSFSSRKCHKWSHE